MYRPNFCAECGEKITRTRWRFWTSRRFCLNCEGRFGRRHIVLPLIASVLLLSTGLFAGRGLRPRPAPLIVERKEQPSVPAVTNAAKESNTAEAEAGADSSASPAPKPEPKYGADGTATERPTDPEEVVSICGARTQKGTPCQRRVRGIGRCWQHKGMPAILPPSKLVIQAQ